MFFYPFEIVHNMFEGDHISLTNCAPFNIDVLWGVLHKNISLYSFIMLAIKISSRSSSPSEDEVDLYSKSLFVFYRPLVTIQNKLTHIIK